MKRQVPELRVIRAFQLLAERLPRAEVIELEGLGHLGPITHPQRVTEPIEAFLQKVSDRRSRPIRCD